MGMYTGLRFRGYVKPEYREMIGFIMNEYSDGRWEDYVPQFPFLERFANLPRSSMIPWGSLSYMPDEWDDMDNILTSSFSPRRFDSETGYWAFQCSLKNYDSEIGVFLEDVIREICSSTEFIEYLYEEWESSDLYQLQDGEIVKTGRINYDYDENYNKYSWGMTD